MSFFWSFFSAPQSSRLWRRGRKAPECFHSVIQAGQAMCARPTSDETSTRPTSWRDLLRCVSFLHEERTPHYDSIGNALSCFGSFSRKKTVLRRRSFIHVSNDTHRSRNEARRGSEETSRPTESSTPWERTRVCARYGELYLQDVAALWTPSSCPLFVVAPLFALSPRSCEVYPA